VRTLRPIVHLVPLLLTSIAAAQFTAKDLLDHDWQRRNDAARALAEQAPDVPALLQVLAADWNGSLPTFGIYGGRGGRYSSRDPRATTLRGARENLVRGQTSPLAHYHGVEALDDLIVPCHPHALARLLLQQHPKARAETTPSPTSIERARAWLQLRQPDDEQIEAACLEPQLAQSITCALWLNGEPTRAQLQRLLQTDNDELRRAAMLLGKKQLFDTPARVDVLVRQLTGSDRAADYQEAGYLLLQLEESAAAALARGIGDDRIPRARCAGMLALLGAHAAPAAETLIRIANTDRNTRRCALIALTDIEIPATLRNRAARVAWKVFEEREHLSKLLALDALGNCGDGVDAEMRAKLLTAIDNPPSGGIKARLLGCLRDLGIATDLTTAQKAYIASTIHPTTSTYLTVADDGPPAAQPLARLLKDPTSGIDTEAVAVRFAATAPNALRLWLADDDAGLRLLALKGLRSLGDDAGVSSKQLVELMAGRGWIDSYCVAWLRERPDAAAFAPQVVAHLTSAADDRVGPAFATFLKEVDLPTAQKLSLYEPLLRRGHAFDAFDAEDRLLVRKEAERMLDDADDPEVRNRLLSTLVRLGLRRDRDITLALRVLQSERNYPVLFHLDDSPTLPSALRAELLEMLTESDSEGELSTDAWYAREILRQHRQR